MPVLLPLEGGWWPEHMTEPTKRDSHTVLGAGTKLPTLHGSCRGELQGWKSLRLDEWSTWMNYEPPWALTISEQGRWWHLLQGVSSDFHTEPGVGAQLGLSMLALLSPCMHLGRWKQVSQMKTAAIYRQLHQADQQHDDTSGKIPDKDATWL